MSSVDSELKSGIYTGWVRHLREKPKKHSFCYQLGVWVLDLDEVNNLESISPWFSAKGKSILNFRACDYLPATVENKDKYCASALKSRVLEKLTQLGAEDTCDRVMFAGQIRHFGIYFSPVNFFFCYVQDTARYMLAEVSNSPWNERHYYLVDLQTVDELDPDKVLDTSDKVFHVSPFMDLNMKYLWRIVPPAKQLVVNIENHTTPNAEQADSLKTGSSRLLSAVLQLERMKFSRQSVGIILRRFPLMTLKILSAIYWQALLLLVKKIPYVPHPGGLKPTDK